MYRTIILHFLLLVLISVFQFSFLSALFYPLNLLNLALVMLVFILSFKGFEVSLWWAFGFGLFFDVLSFAPFGVYVVSLGLAVLLTYLLSEGFFTNRSLYSFLVLMFFATFVYSIFLYTLSYFISIWGVMELNLSWKAILESVFMELTLNILLSFFLFYVVNFISNRYKPVFIAKGK